MATEIGFGTYRIVDQNPEHLQALKLAIESGIRVMDTSTNYMSGASERAIGKVLQMVDTANEIEIISKFGYIQGELLDELKSGHSYKDVVTYSENCYHCISAAFMEEQLTRSLQRLGRDSLECYLIHNPEYYMYDAYNRKIAEEQVIDAMLQRIYDAFVALESEVQKGRIKSYGISSNSFSKDADAVDFLPYEDLMVLAGNAAKEAGNTTHHFTTIQLPINLLEQEGLKCASWAKEQGLRVIVNRPLNAQKNNLMFRLADYDEPGEYYHHLNTILEICDNDVLQSLHTMIEQLDSYKHKFGWIGEYDNFFYAQIIPHIQKSITPLNEESRYALIESLNLFFEQLKKMVAYECSKSTRIQLKELLAQCEDRLQKCAIEFIQKTGKVDIILVGMRKPSYVADITAINL